MRKNIGRTGIEDSKANHDKAGQEGKQIQEYLQAQKPRIIHEKITGMEKYGNKTPLMKFVHKNTGFIVFGVCLAIAIPVIYSMMESQEFFETWSCGNLEWYVLSYNQEIYKQDFPDHNHLTEEQHTRFHEVMAECDFVFEHK